MHTSRKVLLAIIIIVIAAAASFGVYMFLNSKQVKPDTSNTTPSSTTPVKQTALSCVEKLPNTVLIGQKLMPALYATQVDALKEPFAQTGVGGVIVMDETPATGITAFKQGFAIAPTIATDQEGGTVQRYKSGGLLAGATDVAASMTPKQAYDAYYTDAQYLAGLGITTNFGPVVDVISAEPSPLPGRMYSTDPKVVSEYAGQFIQASQKASVSPVIKHFPGLGSTTTNTDNGSATTAPLATLKTRDLIPYQSLAKYKTDAMVSNAIVPDLTDGQPAIWSAAAVDLLRSEGYDDSVVYTDSLTAKAVPGSIEDAAIKSWQAGIDVALIVQLRQDSGTIAGILNSTVASAEAAMNNGQLDKAKVAESVLRILQRKGVDPCAIR